MSNILAPEPFSSEQVSNAWSSNLAKLAGNSRRFFLFVLFILGREDELHGVLGNSQNQWERDTNVALSCPPVATAVTALWHSHCSVRCCCFYSQVWKYPISVDILGVAKNFPKKAESVKEMTVLFPNCLYLNKTCAGFHGTKNRSTLRDSCSHHLSFFLFLGVFFVALIGSLYASAHAIIRVRFIWLVTISLKS